MCMHPHIHTQIRITSPNDTILHANNHVFILLCHSKQIDEFSFKWLCLKKDLLVNGKVLFLKSLVFSTIQHGYNTYLSLFINVICK
jgi:sulfur transfer complex TusBCD TusB component (DsrH family)